MYLYKLQHNSSCVDPRNNPSPAATFLIASKCTFVHTLRISHSLSSVTLEVHYHLRAIRVAYLKYVSCLSPVLGEEMSLSLPGIMISSFSRDDKDWMGQKPNGSLISRGSVRVWNIRSSEGKLELFNLLYRPEFQCPSLRFNYFSTSI